MWYDNIFSALKELFDEKRCYNLVQEINKTDRWFDFSHFSETAAYCAGQLKQIGLEEVDMLELKADGVTAYGDWVAPKAWDVFGAELKVIWSNGKYEQIADYLSTPACLMMYSAPTQVGGIEADIVVAEDSSMLDIKNIKNKIIFTEKPPQDFVSIAHRGGALGIISDYMPLFPGVRDSREDCWKAFRWENNFIYPLNDTGLFGFSLSPEKGSHLREIMRQASLEGESIHLYADVRTKFYNGSIYTISGKIPGSQPQLGEVMVISHLYEPGANDNATGSGLSIELAAIIKRAIDEGKLSWPVRDIRFVMGFECLGLMGYSAVYPDRISNTIAAINLDMVGSSAKDKSKLHLWHNPLSSWSYTDTLLPSLIKAYENFTGDKVEFAETEFAIGDNLLADPSFGVQTMSMLMHPALSYHSSYDTMDRVDIEVLKQNAMISGASIFFLANPGKESVAWLTERLKVDGNYRGIINLDNLFKYSEEGINTVESKNVIDVDRRVIITDKELEKHLKKIIPIRIKKGTLSFHTLEYKIREKAMWKPYYDYQMNCPLFWTDGTRNLFEIGHLAACELRKGSLENYMAELLKYYYFLKQYGYVDWVET